MRVMSLDLGSKSVGICVSDEMQIIAIPVENFIFDEYDVDAAINRVIELIESYGDVELILLGYPMKEDGSEATIAEFIREFKDKFGKMNPTKIKYIDERYSTKRGVELLEQSIKDKEEIKKKKDMAAAYVLLKDYLSTK